MFIMYNFKKLNQNSDLQPHVGVNGSTVGVTLSKQNNYNFNFFSLNYDTSIQSIYSGVDWIYTHVETLYMYDFKINYFWLLNSVYDESIDFFFVSIWYASLQTSGLQLL